MHKPIAFALALIFIILTLFLIRDINFLMDSEKFFIYLSLSILVGSLFIYTVKPD
jgi:hypothetical protein